MTHIELAEIENFNANFQIYFWENIKQIPELYTLFSFLATDGSLESLPESAFGYKIIFECNRLNLYHNKERLNHIVKALKGFITKYRQEPSTLAGVDIFCTIPKFNTCNFVTKIEGDKTVILDYDYQIHFFLYTK